MSELVLVVVALTLTYTMFHKREPLLGYPSAIFWFMLGGAAYTESSATWDIEYLLFFASIGMGIFCALGMYALRKSDASGTDAGGQTEDNND